MVNLPLAFLLVATAVGAAVVGFLLVQVFSRAEGGLERHGAGPHGLPQDGVAFLFDDEELIDATAEGMRLLRLADLRSANAWQRLLGVLGPRFAGIERLRSLAEKGALTLLSVPDDPGGESVLVATVQGGLTRIEIHDGTRESRALVTDPVTWRFLNEELEVLRQISARIPVAAWVENLDGNIQWANSAYMDLVRQARDEVQGWPVPAVFAPGSAAGPLPERINLSLGGVTRWFQMAGHLLPSGHRVNFAEPVDALVRAETSLKEFVQTLSKTFSTLPIGLAVFDRSRTLQVFNPALVQLTGLPVEFLIARPKLLAVLDAMRDASRLPEPKDYRQWRRQLAEMEEAAVNGIYEEVWNLPDGITFRVIGRPHPDGAIALTIQDISSETRRSEAFSNDIALGNAVIDAMPDAVAILSSSGELLHANPAFDELWDVEQTPGLALEALAEVLAGRCAPSPFWQQLREYVPLVGDREEWSGDLRLLDGRAFSAMVRPLPCTSTLVLIRPAPEAAGVLRLSEAKRSQRRA